MKYEVTSEFIRRITNLTEDDYNNIFIDSAVALLNDTIPHDAIGRAMLMADNEYWRWYHRSFRQRCTMFVQHLSTEGADYLGMDVSQSIRERFVFAHTVAGIKSYQKRVPFFMINTLYKRIINEQQRQVIQLKEVVAGVSYNSATDSGQQTLSNI